MRKYKDSRDDLRSYYGQISDLPTLTNYDDALMHYHKIKPLRGSEVRPMCIGEDGSQETRHRRKKHFTIDYRNEVVTCSVDDTPTIMFHKDGSIEIQYTGLPYRWGSSFRYYSNPTRICDFASHILDVGAQVIDGVVHLSFRKDYHLVVPYIPPPRYEDDGNTVICRLPGENERLKVRGKWRRLDLPAYEDRNPDYWWGYGWHCKGIWEEITQLNTTAPKVLRVNKEVATQARRTMRSLTKDCIRIAKLVNFDSKTLTQNADSREWDLMLKEGHDYSLAEIEKLFEDKREQLVPIIFGKANCYDVLTAAAIREAALDILKEMHKDYFVEINSPEGVKVSDPNRRYWARYCK